MYQDSKRLSPQRFKRFKLDGQAVQLVGMFALSGQLVSWSVGGATANCEGGLSCLCQRPASATAFIWHQTGEPT